MAGSVGCAYVGWVACHAVRSEGREGLPVDELDRELWARLRVVVSGRPVLASVAEPTSPEMLRAGWIEIARTVRELDSFADEVSARLLSGDVPADPGSARAVAGSVVRLSRVFIATWAGVPVPTAAALAQFNREVELLAACLDSIVPRLVPDGSAPEA